MISHHLNDLLSKEDKASKESFSYLLTHNSFFFFFFNIFKGSPIYLPSSLLVDIVVAIFTRRVRFPRIIIAGIVAWCQWFKQIRLYQVKYIVEIWFFISILAKAWTINTRRNKQNWISCACKDSPNMTSQITFIRFHSKRGHFWLVFVNCSEIVEIVVMSWAPQFSQNPVLKLFLICDAVNEVFWKVLGRKKNCPNFVAFDL